MEIFVVGLVLALLVASGLVLSRKVSVMVGVGVFLILVGLASIPSPLALQWLATIGAVVLIAAYFYRRRSRRMEERFRTAQGPPSNSA